MSHNVLLAACSPVFEYLFGFHVFGLGFLTSMLFIFCTGTALQGRQLAVLLRGTDDMITGHMLLWRQ
jgi:hypothetical protein